ncbi:Spy/CpxP family protein refolding chaperone [Stutzerimonas tarimensis]|uniref:Spy/CpxP family protein refolding chaperone n=1 Tax=Stutzerimonas tarimensis TaxID=1507735 RepID=A0ABV7T8Q9_9GAMM
MRKTLTALVFAASLPVLAFAMPGPGGMEGHDGHGKRGGQHHQMFHKDLDLTKEQRSEMRKLMSEQFKAQHEITQRYLDKLPEAERNALTEERKASQEKTHQAMRGLLKPEQQVKFDEAMEKMKEKRAERAEFEKWKADRAQQ